ncbi:MAG: hypothetical protein ACFB03_01245 [Paracoccaceae bacterium]
MQEPVPPSHPFLTSAWLWATALWYDGIAKPCLAGLAIISSATAVIGYAGQYDQPTLEVYLRCLAIGFALWLITRTFWAGAWVLPMLETKRTIATYAVVAVIGFACFFGVSSIGSLGATGGGISDEITQSKNTDELENFGQAFGIYSDQMSVTAAALAERADQAEAFAEAEIAGQGPTGVAGAGPVSNAFYASRGKYADAADLLEEAQSRASAHQTRLSEIIAEMRDVQVDAELGRGARSAKLKSLSGQAISEMRALLALDPARSITAAAEIIATGVPEPSRANDSSRARIADIRAEMEGYAASLRMEAQRIAAMKPELPQLVTLSPSEKLIANMWRMPGLTMAALLLDLCGWIAVGFRLAIYEALKACIARENANDAPEFIMTRDLRNVVHVIREVRDSQKAIEDSRPTAKRGRPPKSTKKGDDMNGENRQ